MIIFRQNQALQTYLKKEKNDGKRVGFVPTMGALHKGHLELVNQAAKNCDLVVVSVYVNPTQFNQQEDFDKYPITPASDIDALLNSECAVLFTPSTQEIYPNGTDNLPFYNLGVLETVLEGAHRPGHFQGVCAVVERLLRIVGPDELFLGQKDLQQCTVIQKLLELTPDIEVKLTTIPTVREESGLALSSRNKRLSEEGKRKASILFQVLQAVGNGLQHGDLETVVEDQKQYILENGFESIDYLQVADLYTLEPILSKENKPVAILVAATIEGVRLIDNIIIH
jgi:pantoate--beta-alanine ligase